MTGPPESSNNRARVCACHRQAAKARADAAAEAERDAAVQAAEEKAAAVTATWERENQARLSEAQAHDAAAAHAAALAAKAAEVEQWAVKARHWEASATTAHTAVVAADAAAAAAAAAREATHADWLTTANRASAAEAETCRVQEEARAAQAAAASAAAAAREDWQTRLGETTAVRDGLMERLKAEHERVVYLEAAAAEQAVVVGSMREALSLATSTAELASEAASTAEARAAVATAEAAEAKTRAKEAQEASARAAIEKPQPGGASPSASGVGLDPVIEGSLESIPANWAAMLRSHPSLRLSGSSELVQSTPPTDALGGAAKLGSDPNPAARSLSSSTHHSTEMPHPHPHGSPLSPNNNNASLRQSMRKLLDLTAENDRLKLVVRDMRAAMEALQQGLEAHVAASPLSAVDSLDGAADVGAAAAAAGSDWPMREHLATLQRVSAEALTVGGADGDWPERAVSAHGGGGDTVEKRALQLENDMLRRELQRAWEAGGTATTTTTTAAAATANDDQEQVAGRSEVRSDSAADAAAAEEPEELRSAREDISRLMDERDRLLEMTHALQMALRGYTQRQALPPQPPPPPQRAESPALPWLPAMCAPTVPMATPGSPPRQSTHALPPWVPNGAAPQQPSAAGDNCGHLGDATTATTETATAAAAAAAVGGGRPRSARQRIAEARDGAIELEALHANAVERPRRAALLASEQYTASQRGKLRALASKPARSAVRNFNIVDDREAQSALGVVVAGKHENPDAKGWSY